MQRFTFLLSFLLFLSWADASTLVLKNGRSYSGEIRGDDGVTVQFRDAGTGVVLSLKKAQIDDAATREANSADPAPPVLEAPSASVEKPKEVADLARELRQQRTGRSRIYTAQDLHHAPQLSISGSPEPEAEAPLPASSSAADERRWRTEARTLRKELEAARDRASTASAACQKAKASNRTELLAPHQKPLELGALRDEPPECLRLAELNERLQQARDRFDAFEIRARRAGVPWHWLE